MEYERYTVTEGQTSPLNICGYLVNVTQEITPPPELVATVINDNGLTSKFRYLDGYL